MILSRSHGTNSFSATHEHIDALAGLTLVPWYPCYLCRDDEVSTSRGLGSRKQKHKTRTGEIGNPIDGAHGAARAAVAELTYARDNDRKTRINALHAIRSPRIEYYNKSIT